jgi:hypothetical protein
MQQKSIFIDRKKDKSSWEFHRIGGAHLEGRNWAIGGQLWRKTDRWPRGRLEEPRRVEQQEGGPAKTS